MLQTVVDMNPGETEQAAMGRAVGQVVAAVEDDWKTRRRAARAGGRLPVAVPLAGLASWVQIRRELDGPAGGTLGDGQFVRSVRGPGDDRLFGRAGTLTLAVGEVGLSLAEESDGWLLRPAGGLGDYSPSTYRPLRPERARRNTANLLTLARLVCVVPIVWLVRSWGLS